MGQIKEKNSAIYVMLYGILQAFKQSEKLSRGVHQISYEALAADPSVEVVYIGAVNTEHVKICKMMFEAGKHVLCEKPLAINVRETKEIIDAAKNSKESKGTFQIEC